MKSDDKLPPVTCTCSLFVVRALWPEACFVGVGGDDDDDENQLNVINYFMPLS